MLFILLCAILPSTISVQQEITIKAEKKLVENELLQINNWKDWRNWPGAERKFLEKGIIYIDGKGNIVASVTKNHKTGNSHVSFSDIKIQGIEKWKLQQSGDSTTVICINEIALPVYTRMMNDKIAATIKPSLESSLIQLKQFLELNDKQHRTMENSQ
jgi:hypothetical protein